MTSNRGRVSLKIKYNLAAYFKSMLSKLLLKYLYANSYEEALIKGKKIFKTSNISIVEQDNNLHTLTTKVKDDTYNFFYKVTIRNYNDVKRIFIRCNCNSKSHYLCKHKIGTLFLLMSVVDKYVVANPNPTYQQSHTIIGMKNIDIRKLKSYATDDIYRQAQEFLTTKKVRILESEQSKVTGEFKVSNDEKHLLTIFFNTNKEFETSCTCSETEAPLCTHKLMLFLQILGRYGADYFSEIRDFEAEKEMLLDYYYENQKDPEKEDHLEFDESDAKKIKLKVTPQATATLSNLQLENLVSKINLPASTLYGILLDDSVNSFPFFEIEILLKEDGRVSRLDKQDKNLLVLFQRSDKEIIKDIAKISLVEATKNFQKIHFSTKEETDVIYYEEKSIPPKLRTYFYTYYFKQLERLCNQNFYKIPIFVAQKPKEKLADLQPFYFASKRISPIIKIVKDNKKLNFEVFVQLTNKRVAIDKLSQSHKFYFYQNRELFFWKNERIAEMLLLIENLQQETVFADRWKEIFQTKLMPFIDSYEFEFDEKLVKVLVLEKTSNHLVIKENEEYIYLTLQFTYGDFTVEYNKSNHLIYTDKKGESVLVERDKKDEEALFSYIESLSERWEIVENDFSDYKFFIKKSDALLNSWFLTFLEKIKEKNITISGIELLKDFTPVEKSPKVSLDIKSGIDWLDVGIKVELDDQEIGIDELVQMFKSESNLIHLGNNKVVALPVNWIKKYKVLFALAERQSKNALKLQNSQIGILQYIEKEEDKAYLSINWNERIKELAVPQNKKFALPYGLNDVLRNFQIESVKWADNLISKNCNGLLSDDMGLGKTLQSLAILSLYKSKKKQLLALVVCPTSLTHTWSSEIEKFTPDLSYLFYHGKDRQSKAQLKNINQNLIITTYGTIRNDFQFFKQFDFDYIVLDESQNIKNPQSKTYQTLLKLNAKNKLCLSGTPLQNNTVDMFAQMSFLNHGMFGSLNWFKNQFSTPIDKFGDYEIKNMLRKILQPLILRRTKEEVSPELPEKTVSTIYCEMEPEQRKIYETYKNEFRNTLLGKIKKDGIGKSKFHILQALLMLRQICNTPALIKTSTALPRVSIKNDILISNILENVQSHKILVFSQFLGMLDLIKDSLIKHKVPYEYLDGSLSITKRKEAIDRFQNEGKSKVFLISLKAGGLGLTLTAADYVYIIDPWWNPAIEAQAIDRTHRIGQTKKIIASKLICKNTVEEKIVLLQQKKIALNNEIIEKEESLLQKMDIEDIDFLLS